MLPSQTNLTKKRPKLALRKLTIVMGGLLAASQAWSQGVISGRVADANGAALPGAQIQVQGQSVSGTTNNQGEFTLPQVPAGSHTLVIEYLGYRPATQAVTVADGQRANATITLLPAGNGGAVEEVVVIARPIVDGQARALNQQRMADNISNVISADAIGRFPDTNIAEALQRTPGIGIERDQGEGRYINVRGAPAEFSAVAIDGVSLPASDPSTRAVDLDTIPSDIVSQIEVSKTLQPMNDADSISGAVNIVTRSPFDRIGAQVRASGGSGYNEMGSKSDSRGNLLVSNLFGARQEFGALLSLSYSKTRRQVDNVESGWAVVERPEGNEGFGLVESLFKDYDTRRERAAATGMLEWRPSDTDKLFVRGSYARFTDDEFRNRLSILWDGTGTLQPGSTDLSAAYSNTRVEKQFRHRVQRNDISSIQFGGEHELAEYKTDYTLSFSRAEQSYPNRDELLFRNSIRPTLSYDFRSNPREPAISLFNGTDHLQLDRYAFRENTFRSNDALEDEFSLMANIEFPSVAFDLPVTYRLGMKFRGREKDHDEERWRDRRPTSAPTSTLAQFISGHGSSNFSYNLGNKMEADLVQAYLDGARASSVRRMPNSLTADYQVEEDILAAYAQARFDLTDVTDVVIGLRIEQTDFTGSSISIDEDTGVITDRMAENSYTDLFPGITLRHEFSDQLIGRAALTRAINRPNFPDLVPLVVQSDETVTLRRVEAGNPDLKPTMTTNLDLMLEYYMEPLGILSGGLFYKDIQDYRFTLTRNGQFEGANAIISRPENAPDGRIYGAEINWQQQLTMLPDWMAGFGYMFNYTYTDAEMDLAQPYNGRQTFALTNQSKTNWNAALFYEDHGLSVRLSYTDRSDFIDEINVDDPRLDLYWQGRSQLDLTASYQASEQWEVFFEGKNLSDTAGLRFYGTPSRVYEYEQFGAIYFLGVRYNH